MISGFARKQESSNTVMDELKISVIIPIYNVENYLEKCLSSVINQTYGNLEIICIDDGSQDSSGRICDAFAAKDARISVIHKVNGGVSSARNAGLERCTGDFISFVDGDDWLEPEMYRVLVGQITSEDIDISACGYYFEDFDGAQRIIKNEEAVPEQPVEMRDFLKYIYIREKYRAVAGYLWTRLFRKEVIAKSIIMFDPQLDIGQDIAFSTQYYMKARKAVYTSVPLYHYVQRKGSAVHDVNRRLNGLGICVAYQRAIDLYEINHVDREVIDYVKRFYVYHTSALLKLAYEYGVKDKVAPLKKNIRKYFDAYCRTNQDYPERIQEVQQLLDRTT